MSNDERCRLLVIDDDVDGAEGLADLLSVWEHEVDIAHDMAGAVRQVQAKLPQVAFVDLRLGQESGIELIGRLKADYPDIVTIVITANADRESPIAALRAGAHDYLCKPIDFDDLAVALNRGIAHYRLVDENRRIWAELHEAKARAEHLAHTDVLTGLSNRAGFYRDIHPIIENATETGRSLPMLLIDLDGFKQVNDRYGHLIGDALLRGVADRMKDVIGQIGLLCRLGGDEFALVCANERAPDAVCALAEKLIDCISQPYEIQDRRINIGASIGSSYLHENGNDLSAWFHAADTALYTAKAAGRGRHACFADINKEMPEIQSVCAE